MARPLVPFPIFPPLRYWHGSQSFSSLANRSVSERLRKIDPISQPFSTVELCNEFLGRSAQNCPGPMQFGAVIRKLELMLMWSFHRGISLLSWDADLAVAFLKFWKHPPATWTSSTTHLRFIPDTQVPFIDWQINDRWRMFRRPLGADGNPVVPVLSVLCALVKVAFDFFDFCQSTGRSSGENPFANWSANEVLRLSRSRARPVLSKHQMDWMFEFVAERIAVRRSYEVRVFLALNSQRRYLQWLPLGVRDWEGKERLEVSREGNPGEQIPTYFTLPRSHGQQIVPAGLFNRPPPAGPSWAGVNRAPYGSACQQIVPMLRKPRLRLRHERAIKLCTPFIRTRRRCLSKHADA